MQTYDMALYLVVEKSNRKLDLTGMIMAPAAIDSFHASAPELPEKHEGQSNCLSVSTTERNVSQAQHSGTSSPPGTLPSATVMIPDLFESFMSRTPFVNPHYQEVFDGANAWCDSIYAYNEKEQKTLRRADFSYFAAIAYPDCEADKLRTTADWFNWVFAFDDQLDDGPLGQQKEESAEYIYGMLAVLGDNYNSESDRYEQPLRYALRSIWQRVEKDPTCAPGAQKRWLKGMVEYFEALQDSFGFLPLATKDETIAGYLKYRFDTIGVKPIFSFVEYTSRLHIPDEVFQHSSMIELETIGVEVQCLANDIVSYHRERDLGCPHNIVYLLRHHGLSEQEAYDHVHGMLVDRYKRWYLVQASLPILGERIDKQVRRYISGMENVALANAHWSFRTERYYGKHRQQVRATRIVEVAVSKADWLPPIFPKASSQEVRV